MKMGEGGTEAGCSSSTIGVLGRGVEGTVATASETVLPLRTTIPSLLAAVIYWPIVCVPAALSHRCVRQLAYHAGRRTLLTLPWMSETVIGA